MVFNSDKYIRGTKPLISINSNLSNLKSYVGMIVQSTTLDTIEKVIAIYGGIEWQKIEGRFLLGASAAYVAGSTGGEAMHTLTIAEMPSHSHMVPVNPTYHPLAGGAQDWAASSTMVGQVGSGSVGGNYAHNNIPPYRAVYIWERTV